MLGLIFILRALSLYPTIYPSPSFNCKKNRKNIMPVEYCHDCMFSGHLAFTLLPILLLIYHGFSPIIVLYPVFFSIFQIASRAHYSIDILISWYITTLVFIIVQFDCLQKMFIN